MRNKICTETFVQSHAEAVPSQGHHRVRGPEESERRAGSLCDKGASKVVGTQLVKRTNARRRSRAGAGAGAPMSPEGSDAGGGGEAGLPSDEGILAVLRGAELADTEAHGALSP